MRSYAVIGSRPSDRLEFGKGSTRNEQENNGNGQNELLRFVPVRDYKERAILRGLQVCARSESPGFVWFDHEEYMAKLAWLRRGRYSEVVGYCISKEGRNEYSTQAKREVNVPRFISQIFVIKEQRRRLIASMMISDFISDGGNGSLWVESPKRETIELLHKLGYHESRERYQLWEMMFGLTCWSRIGNINEPFLPFNQELTSADCNQPWLWSGNDAIEMATLR